VQARFRHALLSSTVKRQGDLTHPEKTLPPFSNSAFKAAFNPMCEGLHGGVPVQYLFQVNLI